jgi:hypothetical protein
MGVDGDPLHCSACGREIGPAEAMASRREFGRYLCLACMESTGEGGP